MIEVIVCDFPVPGGPWSTKLSPSYSDVGVAADIALSCELSAVIGSRTSLSLTSGIAERFLASHVREPLIRLSTTLFLAMVVLWLCMSFHITNDENEKLPSTQDLTIDQPFMPAMWASTSSKTLLTSIPCSSVGSSPWSSVTSISKSCLNFSRIVMLIRESSSLFRIAYPRRIDLRISSTGISSIGAKKGSGLSFSYHLMKPTAR